MVTFLSISLILVISVSAFGFWKLSKREKDFEANKQFTQNASHELQTPLTVIKANAELLIQSPNIGEKEMEVLGIILSSVNRLSKINTALIMLSKIEHGRYSDLELVNFRQVFQEELRHFKDLIQLKEIKVTENYEAEFKTRISATLAGILVANLLQNAIRHNSELDGFINVSMNEKWFTITNPGLPLKSPAKLMFHRFNRESESDESLGLGLSIIKRITDFFNLDIDYQNEGNIHSVTISSPNHH